MPTSFQSRRNTSGPIPKSTTTGLGALVALTILGALSAGVFGAAVFFGLTIFGTGLWHAVVGRSWLTPILPHGRKVGVLSLVTGIVAMSLGTAVAPPPDDPSIASGVSTSLSPSPSASRSSAAPSETPSPVAVTMAPDGTAVAALAQLEIKGRAPKTGYSREEFGQAWLDVDRNGCDTRNDILRRDLTQARTKPGSQGCAVMTGALQDPFTGNLMEFVRGTESSGEIHIDHVVALSDAWQKGAQQWTQEQRSEFANDPLNLLAVQGVANQQKGDGDAATWLPANKAFRCDYVARQIAVKTEYEVWVTQAEHDAMEDILFECPETMLPSEVEPPATADSIDATPAATSTEPMVAVTPTTPAAAPPAPTTPAAAPPTPEAVTPDPIPPAPEPVEPDPVPADVYYQNCTAVREAGADPIYRGQPGYSSKLDRDDDGVACE